MGTRVIPASREYTVEKKLEIAEAALLVVAAQTCGNSYDLRTGMDPTLILVLSALKALGAVETFEHEEEYSGTHGIDYVGSRFTPVAVDKLKAIQKSWGL